MPRAGMVENTAQTRQLQQPRLEHVAGITGHVRAQARTQNRYRGCKSRPNCRQKNPNLPPPRRRELSPTICSCSPPKPLRPRRACFSSAVCPNAPRLPGPRPTYSSRHPTERSPFCCSVAMKEPRPSSHAQPLLRALPADAPFSGLGSKG